LPDQGPDDLQFQRAEPVSGDTPVRRCAACQRVVPDQYYQVQAKVICPQCAERIRAGQQAQPTGSFARAVLYGVGAALAGCAIYAAVAIVSGYEFALLAILVGWMVAKAIRYGSNGRGGRPQQILAVVLTYFAITASYIPVAFHGSSVQPAINARLIGLMLAAPFLSLTSGVSGILTLIIIFVGMSQAWRLTRASDILITGPYDGNHGTASGGGGVPRLRDGA
jgi:hypothetical protein